MTIEDDVCVFTTFGPHLVRFGASRTLQLKMDIRKNVIKESRKHMGKHGGTKKVWGPFKHALVFLLSGQRVRSFVHQKKKG